MPHCATILHFTVVDKIATDSNCSFFFYSPADRLRSRACAGGEGASWNVSWSSLMGQQKSLLEVASCVSSRWAIWFSISAKVCLVYFSSHDLAAGTWTSCQKSTSSCDFPRFSSIFSACLFFLQPNSCQVFRLVASLSLDRATAWAKGSSGYTAALLCSLWPGSYDDASRAVPNKRAWRVGKWYTPEI